MSKKANTIEYQWEAFDPETGVVAKRGPIREDLSKVEKYADEIQAGIDGMNGVQDGWTPAIYWYGLKIRIKTREITPWAVLQRQTSEIKV